jgi:hypothetical protein
MQPQLLREARLAQAVGQATGTGYLNPSFPLSIATNFKQNNATVAVCVTNARTTLVNSQEIGSDDGGSQSTYIMPIFSNGNSYFNNNGTNAVGSVPASSQGTWINTRTGASVHLVYLGGSLQSTINDASVGVSTVTPFIGADNNSGTAQWQSQDTLFFASIGSGLTPTQAANLTTYIQTMAASLSVSGC